MPDLDDYISPPEDETVDHEVVDCGIDNASYVQGWGDGIHSFKGSGYNAYYAFEEALEMAAQAGWDTVVQSIQNPYEDQREEDTVRQFVIDNDDGQLEGLNPDSSEYEQRVDEMMEGSELYYYVQIIFDNDETPR